jgi:hypothetical protein
VGRIKPIADQTLAERCQCISVVFDLSPATIRTWHYQGCNLWDVEEVCQWAQFKRSRRKNWRSNGDKPARRVRTPFG